MWSRNEETNTDLNLFYIVIDTEFQFKPLKMARAHVPCVNSSTDHQYVREGSSWDGGQKLKQQTPQNVDLSLWSEY